VYDLNARQVNNTDAKLFEFVIFNVFEKMLRHYNTRGRHQSTMTLHKSTCVIYVSMLNEYGVAKYIYNAHADCESEDQPLESLDSVDPFP